MKSFSNIKIRTKLLASFLLVSLITGFIGYMGIKNLDQIEKADSNLYEKMTVPLADLTNLSVAFQRIRANVRDAIITNDISERDDFFKVIAELKTLFENSVKQVELTILTAEAKKDVTNLHNAFDEYVKTIPEVEQLLKANNKAGAIEIMRGKMKLANDACQKAVDELQKSKIALAKKTSDENTILASNSINIMISLIVVALIASIILGLIIASSIQSTIKSVITE